MKIGIFSDTYVPQVNGVVTSIALMDKKLRQNGHETYIFTVSFPADEPVHDPPHVFRIPSVRFYGNSEHRIGLLYSPRAVRKARELGIELVHSHAPFSMGLFGHITARRLQIPEVHTYHTMLEDYGHYLRVGRLAHRRIAQNYSRVFCNLVDGIIVPTEKVRDALLRYGVRPPIHILPTGIELDIFTKRRHHSERQAARQELGLQPDDRVVLSVGRLAPEKSVETLLWFHKALVGRDRRWRLIIIGSGDHQAALEAETARLGLQEYVRFAGRRSYESLPVYYQTADVFVTASTSETQGLVVLEAMASGLPVVAVDDPSFHSMIQHGRTGFLFQTESEYVRCVESLAAPDETTAAVTQRARAHAQMFSAEAFCQKLLSIYDTVLREFRGQ